MWWSCRTVGPDTSNRPVWRFTNARQGVRMLSCRPRLSGVRQHLRHHRRRAGAAPHLAMQRRQGGHTHIEPLLARAYAHASVLWQTTLRDIQPASTLRRITAARNPVPVAACRATRHRAACARSPSAVPRDADRWRAAPLRQTTHSPPVRRFAARHGAQIFRRIGLDRACSTCRKPAARRAVPRGFPWRRISSSTSASSRRSSASRTVAGRGPVAATRARPCCMSMGSTACSSSHRTGNRRASGPPAAARRSRASDIGTSSVGMSVISAAAADGSRGYRRARPATGVPCARGRAPVRSRRPHRSARRRA